MTGDPLTLGYDFCGPRVCVAQGTLDPKLIDAIKAAKKASASYVVGSKQLVQVPLDPSGFTDAFDFVVSQLP